MPNGTVYIFGLSDIQSLIACFAAGSVVTVTCISIARIYAHIYAMKCLQLNFSDGLKFSEKFLTVDGSGKLFWVSSFVAAGTYYTASDQWMQEVGMIGAMVIIYLFTCDYLPQTHRKLKNIQFTLLPLAEQQRST